MHNYCRIYCLDLFTENFDQRFGNIFFTPHFTPLNGEKERDKKGELTKQNI